MKIEDKIIRKLIKNCPIEKKTEPEIKKVKRELFIVYTTINENKTKEEIQKIINKKAKNIINSYRKSIKQYKETIKKIPIQTEGAYESTKDYISIFQTGLLNFYNCWEEKKDNIIEKAKKIKIKETENPLMLRRNIYILENIHTEIITREEKIEKHLKGYNEFVIKYTNILEITIEKLKEIENIEKNDEKMKQFIKTIYIQLYKLIETYVEEKNIITIKDDEQTKKTKEKNLIELKNIRKKLIL